MYTPVQYVSCDYRDLYTSLILRLKSQLGSRMDLNSLISLISHVDYKIHKACKTLYTCTVKKTAEIPYIT